MYQVVDVSDWIVDGPEPGGREANLWLTDAAEVRWLYKPAVVRHGRRQGEDWSEKAAAELAPILGVPAARVEMATRATRPGAVSRNLLPGVGWEMHSGAVRIGEVDPRFSLRSEDRLGHNLDNIGTVLHSVAPPAGWGRGVNELTAFDVFCGFLVFDAWIANRDRHAENWSLLVDPEGHLSLAPSYDHASGLGFNLTDDRRTKVLNGYPGMETWAARGTAWRFEGGQRRTLVELARSGLAMASARARRHWRDQLEALSLERCASVVAAVPNLSEVTRSFCLTLLETNRRRLLDVC